MAGTAQLGEAQIPIRATLDKLDGDLQQARGKVEGALGKLAQGVGKGIQGLGVLALGAGGAAVGALAGIGTAIGKLAVDAAPVDGSDPVEAYHAIREELRLYSEKLAEKREIVAANKMDLEGARDGFERLREALEVEVLPMSAVTGEGIRRLVGRVLEVLDEVKSQPAEEPEHPEL